MIKRFASRLIPYLTIGIGLYLLKSAWLGIGLYHLGMLVFILTDPHRPPFKTTLQGWDKKWALLLIPGCTLGGVTIYLVWPWMQRETPLIEILSVYGLSGASWIIFMVYYGCFHPILEQYYWRGYLENPSRRIRIEDLSFAGYHFFTMILFVRWPWALFSFVVLLGSAWLWRQIGRDAGGLLIPALSHLSADLSIILAVHFLIRM